MDVVSIGGWTNYVNSYNSVLKLHAGGNLNFSNGILGSNGLAGYFWSSTQFNNLNGWYQAYYNAGGTDSYNNLKAYGFSVRCVLD